MGIGDWVGSMIGKGVAAGKNAYEQVRGKKSEIEEEKIEIKQNNSLFYVCSNCGKGLSVDEKFCSSCGTPIMNNVNSITEEKIQRCPNCGEIISALQVECIACGYQFRGLKTTSAAQELMQQLENIEKQRLPKKKDFFGNLISVNDDKIDKNKVDLIRNFPIPNTKEDIFEFLLLAGANQEMKRTTWKEAEMADAWRSKYKQAYEKANLLFGNDEKFLDYQERNQKKIRKWLR